MLRCDGLDQRLVFGAGSRAPCAANGNSLGCELQHIVKEAKSVPISYHPQFGSIVSVQFEPGFKEPEMVKKRLCVVLSRAMGGRESLITVVPLSTTEPKIVRPYHMRLTIPFDLPEAWGPADRWVKGDMVYSVGFHRVDLLRLGKDRGGRVYQKTPLPAETLKAIQACVLHGLGMSSLVKHLSQSDARSIEK